MSTAAYSKTPLAKKLGIKAGTKVYLVNVPDNYFQLFTDFPEEVILSEKPDANTLDFIHVFVHRYVDLEEQIPKLKPFLKKTGMLWVSWPKGSSSISTDLKREPIRAFILQNGLVDTKVCAVDENWSGLKFMFRLKDR